MPSLVVERSSDARAVAHALQSNGPEFTRAVILAVLCGSESKLFPVIFDALRASAELEVRWLREAIRSLEKGGMCTQCLAEIEKGEDHDEQCPVGFALAQADAAISLGDVLSDNPAEVVELSLRSA